MKVNVTKQRNDGENQTFIIKEPNFIDNLMPFTENKKIPSLIRELCLNFFV